MSGGCDLVTFGEPLVRLSPPHFNRLEVAPTLDVRVGGSELNTAIAASQLGLATRYVTRLTRNPLGRMVCGAARASGVDTSHVVWTDESRVGLYFTEFGASPRANSVVYDRRHSAIAEISAGEIDWAAALAGAKAFHTSGITPALSKGAADATLEGAKTAKRLGITVSVDLNYRARLWSEKDARQVMTQLTEQADLLLTTEEDTARVFGIREDSYEVVAQRLARQFDLRAVAITLRETPSVWRNGWTAIAYDASSDQLHRGPQFDIEIVDRIGAGDSFAGGFLYGYLTGGVTAGLQYGIGISALKQTMPGDIVYASREEVERLLQGGDLRIQR
ncbi:MAG: sugar kinase [Candidatus Bipolaricaulota bacterium]